jgi:hypothetical protein
MDTPHMPAPTKGSPRVAAWVYTVINPVIDSLRRESELLSAANLSWRSFNGHCEFIRPIRAYIDVTDFPNYEDFLADNREFSARFSEHDQRLERLEAAAQEVCNVLVSDRTFQDVLQQTYSEYESHVAPDRPQHPSLQGMKDRLAADIAELLINNTASLPSHYMGSVFWSEYSKKFQQFKRHPSFEKLHSAAAELRKDTDILLRALEERRLSLCRMYDIPAAPVRVYRNANEDVFFSR